MAFQIAHPKLNTYKGVTTTSNLLDKRDHCWILYSTSTLDTEADAALMIDDMTASGIDDGEEDQGQGQASLTFSGKMEKNVYSFNFLL